MYNVLISNKYLEDVEDIFSYIASTLCNVDAALNLKEKLNIEIEKLTHYPFVNSPIETKQNYLFEYRKVKIGNYYMLYYVENMTIIIARLIYAKRDFDNLKI